MQSLGLTCQVLGSDFTKHIGYGQRTVLHFSLGGLADVDTQTDNLIIIHHLPAHGLDGRALLGRFQVGIEQEHIAAGLQLTAVVIYQPAIIAQRIEATEVPRHTDSRYIVCGEIIFQHIQSRISVSSLHEQPEAGTEARL